MVRTVTLLDGKRIPAIGWGSGTGKMLKNGEISAEIGVKVLKAGIRHIDTAQFYETEEAANLAIKGAGLKREDVWVTTKLSQNIVKDSGPAGIKSAVEHSLKQLTFIPDLLLLHSPHVIGAQNLGEGWKILEGLVNDGTLKGASLGLSNFRPQDIEAVMRVATIKPVVNQIEFHPYLLAHLDPVLALQERIGIKTQAYGPLAPIMSHPTGGPIKPVLQKIADKLSSEAGKTVETTTVLLLWCLTKGIIPVTTTSNDERIKGLIGIDGMRDLTDQEVEEIESTGRKIHYRQYKGHMDKEYPSPDLPEDL